MTSTTTTLETIIKDYSSVEWLKNGLVILALLFSIPAFGQSPELFLPGIVTTEFKERDMTISNDGNLLLYSIHSYNDDQRMIVEMKKTGEEWSEPKVVSFSGQFYDIEPMFAPDNQRLYFASNRPLHEKDTADDYNIWYVDRNDDQWGKPVPLDTLINTSGQEYFPSVSNFGTLYFTATRPDTKGKEDIYYSQWQDGGYMAPKSMDTTINTATYEFNAYVDPEERFIIFSSYQREDGYGGGDLYVSFRKAGKWQPSVNMGEQINSDALDYCPFVTASGDEFYFTSSRKDKKKLDNVKLLRQSMRKPKNGFDDIYKISLSEIDIFDDLK